MLPVLKVYDIDYSFILQNYLNPELWSKKWTLFVYKNFVVTLQLYNIDCIAKKVSFKIVGEDNDRAEDYGCADGIFFSNNDYEICYYSLSIDDVDCLKRLINSDILRIIRSLERKLIKSTDGYKEISEARKREKKRLTDIANNFLDNENVSNEDIREAYIDWYVDKMSNETDFAGEYVDNHMYTMLTDVWYVFAKIIDDWSIIREIEEQTSQEEIDRLDEEFEEYKNYIDSEKYEEDMIDGLEDL